MSMLSRDSHGRPQGILFCGSSQARDNWIERLRKLGVNYFVRFLDVQGPALQFCHSEWVTNERGPNGVYICW